MWLELYGAPSPFKFVVRNYLERKFPEKWIGSGAPHYWPARSPYLLSLDFFMGIENIVFITPPTTPDDMKVRTRNAFQTFTPNMLENGRNSFKKIYQMPLFNLSLNFVYLSI